MMHDKYTNEYSIQKTEEGEGLIDNNNVDLAEEKEFNVVFNKDTRFKRYKPNDLWAFILFLIHFIILGIYGGIGAFCITPCDTATETCNSLNFTLPSIDELEIISISIGVSIVVGGFIAVFYLLFAMTFPKLLIRFSAVLLGVFIIIYTIEFINICYQRNEWALFAFWIFEMIFVIIYVVLLAIILWKSAKYISSYIEISVEILRKFKGIILVAILAMFFYVIYLLLILLVFSASYQYLYLDYGYWFYICGFFYLLFSWFWTTQVLKGIVRVTIAGIVARWYYDDSYHTAFQTVFISFFRAVFTSIGSVCFGSFISAIMATLRAFFRIAYTIAFNSEPDNCAGCLLKCFLMCFVGIFYGIFLRLDAALKFFNRYAFTYVGMYGSSFTKAGKATLYFLTKFGLEAVLNDMGILVVLSLQIIFIVFAVSSTVNFVLYCLTFYQGILIDTSVYGTVSFLSIFIGIGCGLVSTELISYCMPCILICTSDSPDLMPKKTPALYRLLREKHHSLALWSVVHVDEDNNSDAKLLDF